ncbi:carboxymuconolactone decarboxylase family protein [Haladaptatus salinisoli]|uniref:carboxymuconolactone decarboxylase family protein n=1 Tax=Haladaptatus salinisoli TaxID=2884876 RepID=UPI001D09AC63|nr:carboxymuconolactone decarboxylase family protein [Haladaptatus salinisoli]
MVSTETREEIEEYLGQVPTWVENLAEPASDQSWELVRDLEFGETDLSAREKALIGVGVAAAIKCPYCIHFHKEDARMEDVTEDELAEAVNLASTTQYFSTILHGAEVDVDEFVDETTEIVEHVEEQRAAAGAD